ncbi:hypothetical protein A0H76_1122 [Hepatospora eriocheir]|uniref:Uncharacterized protein n=1 Tax=Hepatospora eriocheir TaxID=1081669 RepID=A0A1X0QHM6_9MICR|nr:hypothetical protein A0H76_1122 [Hepatospora eriocheir]
MIWYSLNLNVLSTDKHTSDVSVVPLDVKPNEEAITTTDFFEDNDSDILSQNVSENDEGISNKRKLTTAEEDQSSESHKRIKLFKNLPFKKRYIKLHEESNLNKDRDLNNFSIEKPSYFKGFKMEDIKTLSDCIFKLTSDDYDMNDWNIIYKIFYGEEKNISLLPSKEYLCIFKNGYFLYGFYKKKMKNLDPFLISNKSQKMSFYECSLLKIIIKVVNKCRSGGFEYNLDNINCFIYSLNNLMRFTLFYNQLKQSLNSVKNNEKNLQIEYNNLVELFSREIDDLNNYIDTFKGNFFIEKERKTYYSSKYKDNYKIINMKDVYCIDEFKNDVRILGSEYLYLIKNYWIFTETKKDKIFSVFFYEHKKLLLEEFEKYIDELN